MDCNHCKTTVPYIVHESAMARQERTIKRLFIIILVLFLALVGTNVGWLVYESQFEDSVITQEVEQSVDTGDGDAVIAGIGDANYGKG